MKKLKKGDKVWYYGQLWTIDKVYKPHDEDIYLLCKCKGNSVHDDGEPSTEMVIIDIANDIFYPDIPKVRKLIKNTAKLEEEIRDIKQELDPYWLDINSAFSSDKYY